MPMLPVKFQPILVPPDDPFKHDEFEREKLVEPLTQLLESVEHPFVLGVTAPWGCGKTTFVDQWVPYLEKRGWAVIKFNAWENDFSDSALATMIAELRRGVDEIKKRHAPDKISAAVEKVKKAGGALARRLVPATAKFLTLGALDLDKEFEQFVAAVTESIAGDVVKHHEEAKKTIGAFKIALNDLVTELRAGDSPTRLVIVVDELDRCRPTFALEMLEVMKHLFDVDRIVFVLAVDVAQLRESVATVYGRGIDSREYLRRFIDMQFALPPPTPEQLVSSLWQQTGLDELVEKRHQYQQAAYDLASLQQMLQHFAKMFPRTIRFHEHIMARICAVVRTVPLKFLLYNDTLVFLLYLRELKYESYQLLVDHRITPGAAMEALLEGQRGEAFRESRHGMILEGNLVAAVTKHNWEPIKEYKEELGQAVSDARKGQLEMIIMVFEKRVFDHRGYLDYLVPKIELSDQFVDPTKE